MPKCNAAPPSGNHHKQAQKDYKGDFLKVVDIVRSSAVFHSFDDLSKAIVALNKPGGAVRVVRLKDRITTPLPSGCESGGSGQRRRLRVA